MWIVLSTHVYGGNFPEIKCTKYPGSRFNGYIFNEMLSHTTH